MISSLNLHTLKLVADLKKNSTFSLFHFMSLEVIRKNFIQNKQKKTVTLMFLRQFFIEVGLRGQVLRKTSLCGEKCTGNKPKWH